MTECEFIAGLQALGYEKEDAEADAALTAALGVPYARAFARYLKNRERGKRHEDGKGAGDREGRPYERDAGGGVP